MNDTWDYIIIGAGSAGCVLANRLTENPSVRVLLLEAGSSDWNPFIHIPGGLGKLFGPGVNWRFHTRPQKHLDDREVWYPQGKTLGGSSSINAMIYIRCQKEDYDNWAALGNEGWAYNDILPYFKKSEDNSRLGEPFHGKGGPLWVSDQIAPHEISRAFVAANREFGLPENDDFNGETMYGTGFYQVNCRDGLRRSTSVSFLRPIRHRKNLTVLTEQRVTRILTHHGKATGIEVADGTARKVYSTANEIILSSGAINSPRLLILSGIGDAKSLSALGIQPVLDLPGVGQNLHDHLNVNVHVQTHARISYDGHDRLPWAAIHGARWLFSRKGPAASVIVEAASFHKGHSAERPDLQIHVAPATVVRGGQTKIDGYGFTVNSTFLRPQSRGEVTLRSSNPFDEPLIDPNYLGHEVDKAKAIESIRTIRQILSQPAIRDMISHERLPGRSAQSDAEIMRYIRQYACCDYHPVGTCKMGNDAGAVVDSKLRVHGIDGLRVIDSSIMPVLTSGNTNAPTIMIGEKGADLVKQAGAL